MFIVGLGTAVPPHRYTQLECWETFQASPVYHTLDAPAQNLVRRVLTGGTSGILTRHLALRDLREAFDLTPDALQKRFETHAPRLATEAARAALADAGKAPSDIDALLVSTCTGYLCPGLTSYVGERLGLPHNVLGLDLVGQGCGAALPNLRTAEALLAGGRASHVLSICVEVCSAALYFDNDPGTLISACLFGDGAGAAVLSRSATGSRRLRWLEGRTLQAPADRELLRFESRGGMLRNILSPQVPIRAAEHVESLFGETMAAAGVERSSIRRWVLHPGGRDVILALRKKLGLSASDTRFSAEVLQEFGNLSSPSVFFVLQRAFQAADAPAGLWWISSFGAGFSCHGGLLEVN